ncbi:papain-like cysteine peptidase [Streptomyces radicis]|uniref:Papain-like cysteine peptidase n=1 Tax=Streptomyces radicis TaxID=1750517 RepID=A0A3A9VX78_9ACTN|nr:papain-like cysteine peptidase [Streptomyces radicis]RKN05350.1 papain-like cysteine peptidase [Streptomyces radicis]RKN16857.1 papain-like cysteine peptidase [Streptomyces radicis]
MAERAAGAPFDACVGLGYHCESTYQIRRITGEERAHVFDWLDLDLDAVIDAIAHDFRTVLGEGGPAVAPDGSHVVDRRARIRFYHDFHPGPSGTLDAADVQRQLPGVRGKFAFLADRWRELAASRRRVLYVHQDIYDEATPADLARLREAIATRHPGHRFAVLWLRRARDPEGPPPPGVVGARVGLREGRWQGDDAAWDRAFAALDARALWPARPQTA